MSTLTRPRIPTLALAFFIRGCLSRQYDHRDVSLPRFDARTEGAYFQITTPRGRFVVRVTEVDR